MIDCNKIKEIAQAQLADTDLFVVSCTCSPANEIELLVDSDTSVSIDACAALSRAVEAAFDREAEDFSLTVASAGIGSELRCLRQYRKLTGRPVELVQGDYANIKITTREDLPRTENGGKKMRIGHGYDVHRLVEGRKLILGGVEVPFEKGLLGHSDADVLVHAVMDAVLGAAALGDIGQHFPDNDPEYAGADSLKLARRVAEILKEHGFRIENIDATLLCQRPKLAPYIPAMRQNLADAFGLPVDAVSVKATTEEHLGFTGEGLGIAAHAVALIETL